MHFIYFYCENLREEYIIYIHLYEIVRQSLYVLLQVGLQNYNKIILWKAAIQPKNYQFYSKFKLILKYIDHTHFKKPLGILYF